MKGICALMFMFLVVLFAFCATAMGTVIVEIDGEVMVMSTGPPTLGVLDARENQERVETNLMCFISDASILTTAITTNTHNERSGLLLWSNYTNDSGSPLHRWIQG